MGMEFNYDEKGTTSYVFLFAGLSIYLGLASCQKVGGEKKIDKDDIDEHIKKHTQTSLCHAKQKQLEGRMEKKKESCLPMGTAIYWGAWIAIVLLVLKISTFESESVYSPFEVLGLDESAETPAIKKAYRELSRIYHPDRNLDDEDAADKFIRISKAYEALTDEVTRANWEKYGNPDGRQVAEFGIALPAWIIDRDNSHLVLGAYVFTFMLCLPTWVGCWWYNRTKYYSDDVMLQTMKIFGMYIHSPFSIMNLVEKMSWCEEFQLLPIRERLDQTVIEKVVKQIDDLPIIKKWRYPNVPGMPRKTQACLKSRALIHAHLEQLHSELPPPMLEDLNFCLKRVPMLVDAILEVVTYRRKLRPCIAAMHMCQMLVQGTSKEKEDPFMQIPHMNQRIIKSLKSKKTKILTINDFYSLTEESRRGLLGKELNDEPKLLDIEVFGKMFPFVKVSHEVKVADEENVTAGSLVTVSVKLERLKIADLSNSENEERIAKKLASKDGTTVEEEADEQAKILRLYAAKNAKAKKGGKKAPKKKPAKKAEAAPGADEDAAEGDADGEGGEDTEDAAGDDGEKKESGGDTEDTIAVAAAATAATADAADAADAASGDEDDEGADSEDNVSDSEDDFDWGEDDVFQEQQDKMQKMKDKKRKGKESMPVHCPLFPEPKQEWWWVFIGQPGTDALITEPQKVLSLTDEDEIDISFMAPVAGEFKLTVYVISDSYYGIDHAELIKLDVKAGIKQPEPEEEIESEEDDPFLIEESEDSDEDDFA